MRPIKVLTDSCSDLTPALMAAAGLDYAKMNTVCGGQEKPADLSWTPEDVHSFYEAIRGGEHITTTQVPMSEFDRVFRLYLNGGYDIIYIGCSLKQSGSVNTARVLAEELLKEYPGARIACVDSRHASMGEGMIAMEAAKLAAAGKEFDEILNCTEELIRTCNQFCTVHSLEYLHRAGRVKASSAFFGNLLGVKPVLIADKNGEQTPVAKVRGRQNSLEIIVSMLKDAVSANPSGAGTVFLAHADCSAEEVARVRTLLEQELHPAEVVEGYIGPIIGASIGPDAIAIFAFGKEITFEA